jgi:hypothetical protein
MVKKKIHESLFKCDTGTLLAPFHYVSSFPPPKAPSALGELIFGIVVQPPLAERKRARVFTTPPVIYSITREEKSTANFNGKQRAVFDLFSQGPLKKAL